MAIDSAEKRRAVAGIDRIAGPGVTPNTAKDAEWRQQAGYGYSGIAAGEPQPSSISIGCPRMSLGIRIGL